MKTLFARLVGLLAIFALVGAASAGAKPVAQVINGEEAAPGSFPYLAYVTFHNSEGVFSCSGTVISSNVVLTAGHCVLNDTYSKLESPSSYFVVTGNTNWAASPRTVSTVSHIALAPNFTYLTPSYNIVRGDAAILVLSQPIAAPPVRLATFQTWAAGTATALVGWGMTVAGEQPDSLLHVGEAGVQSAGYCGSKFSHYESASLICTQDYPEDYFGTCHGDSGGPLLMIAPGTANEPLQIGITSFVEGECSTELPDYFTNVASVEAWVATKISEYAPTPVTIRPPIVTPAPAPVAPAPVAPAPIPAPPAVVKPTLPHLSGASAGIFARRAIQGELRSHFSGHRGYRAGCTELTTTRQKCHVSWYAGERDYEGQITVYYSLEGSKLVWLDRYVIADRANQCVYYARQPSDCPAKILRK